MAYCRFGNDSDVYCYESVFGGYQVHVANNRFASDEPFPEFPHGKVTPQSVSEWNIASKEWRERAKLVPIDSPIAGASNCFETVDEAIAYLLMLRSNGFAVPEYAIESMREDAKLEGQ